MTEADDQRMWNPPASRLAPATSGKTSIIRIKPASGSGWMVSLEGKPQVHHFVSYDLAMTYARLWATVSAPSALVEHDVYGLAMKRWTFARTDTC
ncbi:MAG: hypothetical protein M5U08_07305 [Burkholderiales bacterium]|nr:hypothetical protein [Burkholderiales bacterium]